MNARILGRTGWRTLAICLLPMLVTLSPELARADSNSVLLINATGAIANYLGTGIRIGQVELGVPDTNNLWLGGNVALTTNLIAGTAGAIDSHPTEVGGVMIATGAMTRGVAPGARLYSVEANATSFADFQTNLLSGAFWLATNQNVQVINLSVRTSVPGNPTLGTNYPARGLDQVVSQTSATVVKSAGNNGPNPNTITEPGGAYNIIVVGAVNNAQIGMATNVTGYSSRGYLGDGRSKPDIIAPGGSATVAFPVPPPADNLIMPTTNNPALPVGSHTTITTNDAGTSFAAPHVAGVVAQMLEGAVENSLGDVLSHAQDPRVIKSVLLNSATKLPGWQQTLSNVGGVTTVTQPLDPNQGAGLLNAAQTYTQYIADEHNPTIRPGLVTIQTNSLVPLIGWDFDTMANLSLTNIYRLDNTRPQTSGRLTLSWYRDTSNDVAFTDLGLANLDLYLWRSTNSDFSGSTLFAQSVSLSNNVEHLYFPTLEAGYYSFGVYYSNYWQAAGPVLVPINYGLAWTFTAVPEPSVLLMLMTGAVVIYARRRRNRGTTV